MKRIAVLGSTGFYRLQLVGRDRALGFGLPRRGLSAHKQIDKLQEQVRQYKPAVVAVTDPASATAIARCCVIWAFNFDWPAGFGRHRAARRC